MKLQLTFLSFLTLFLNHGVTLNIIIAKFKNAMPMITPGELLNILDRLQVSRARCERSERAEDHFLVGAVCSMVSLTPIFMSTVKKILTYVKNTPGITLYILPPTLVRFLFY